MSSHPSEAIGVIEDATQRAQTAALKAARAALKDQPHVTNDERLYGAVLAGQAADEAARPILAEVVLQAGLLNDILTRLVVDVGAVAWQEWVSASTAETDTES